jgi:uncharacterized membrane protein SpoIIM required for sporulation
MLDNMDIRFIRHQFYSFLIIMSFRKQVQTSAETKILKSAIGLLIFVLLFGLFVVGYDQGQLFSLVQGDQAYNDLWIHEFSHDMRHAAGFPCH